MIIRTYQEAYLHRRCQDRIRGYLYKTIEQIKSSEVYDADPQARRQLERVIVFFKLQLRKDHYFGHYFDRSRSVIKSKPDAGISSSQSGDETDSNQNCPYEHCPCKLSMSSYERYVGLFTSRGFCLVYLLRRYCFFFLLF